MASALLPAGHVAGSCPSGLQPGVELGPHRAPGGTAAPGVAAQEAELAVLIDAGPEIGGAALDKRSPSGRSPSISGGTCPRAPLDGLFERPASDLTSDGGSSFAAGVDARRRRDPRPPGRSAAGAQRSFQDGDSLVEVAELLASAGSWQQPTAARPEAQPASNGHSRRSLRYSDRRASAPPAEEPPPPPQRQPRRTVAQKRAWGSEGAPLVTRPPPTSKRSKSLMGEQVTAAEISKLFHMKLSDAAAAMGVGRTVRPTPNAQRPTQRQAPFCCSSPALSAVLQPFERVCVSAAPRPPCPRFCNPLNVCVCRGQFFKKLCRKKGIETWPHHSPASLSRGAQTIGVAL